MALLAVTVTHLCWFLSCDVCSAATEGGTCGQTECRAKRAQCRLCSFAVKGKAVPRSQPGRAGQLCVHVLSVPMESRKHSSSPDPFRVTVTIATRHQRADIRASASSPQHLLGCTRGFSAGSQDCISTNGPQLCLGRVPEA